MPALVAGIHVLVRSARKVVDGRDKLELKPVDGLFSEAAYRRPVAQFSGT